MITANSKIKLFTHTDLDGVGSIVILGLVNYNYSYTLAYPDPADGGFTSNSIGKYIDEFINSEEYKKYDRVFITDLFINSDTAELINSVNDDGRFMVFDHHLGSTEYDFGWLTAKVKIGDVPTCGTELFWDFVAKENHLTDKMDYRQFGICTKFVESVRLYDTWQWCTTKSALSALAQDLNELYHIHGVDKFTNNYINKLLSSDSEFVETIDRALLEYISREKEMYIEKKAKSVNIFNVDKLEFAVVFAEKYNNELLNYILEETGCDVAASVNMSNNTVSLRTKSDTINVSDIAKRHNGGGHAKAAGFVFSDSYGRDIIRAVLGN